MKLISWNANGLKSGPVGQRKADWLLSYMGSHNDIVALAVQETHCQDVAHLAQAIHDMKLKYTVIHSPSTDGDERAGVLLVISKEYKVEDEQHLIQGRVLRVRLLSTIYQTNLDVIVVYGYPAARQPWINHVIDAVDSLVPTIILGDFNFVREPKDRSTNTMTQYDSTN